MNKNSKSITYDTDEKLLQMFPNALSNMFL